MHTYRSTLNPELSFHGTKAWQIDETKPGLCFGYMYAEDHIKYNTEHDCFIYIAVNAHWDEHRFELPIVPTGCVWKLAFEAYGFSAEAGCEKKLDDPSGIVIGPRSSAILIAEPCLEKG